MAEAAAGRDTPPAPRLVEPAATDAPPSVDPQFAELRSLLVGPEQHDLRALEAHVFDSAVQMREVSRVLPEALTLRSKDPELARALGPMIEEAITTSVHRDPKPLADALFPVMGPAIRKAIEHMLSSMMESFNRTIEQSVSWRALQWRLMAWRSGKTFAEVVLLNTLKYRVEQVFLIHAESGLLLQHVTASRSEGQDADQVSAMLTAIRDFVHDSFAVGGSRSLDAFRVGDLAVTVEQGPYAILAGVVRGTAPPDVPVMFRRALESIHLMLGSELKAFKGDSAPFERARPALETCLVTQLREPKSTSYTRWVAVAALLLAGLGVWTFTVVRARQRFQAYVDRLANEPGIVVLSSGRRGGKFVVTGLRDPLAADPAGLLAGARVDPSTIETHWQPYQGLHPEFVVARATTLLRPPQGVTLDYHDGVLEARGTAPERWLIDSERMAPAIGGVRQFTYAGTSPVQQLTQKIEAIAILFPKGQGDPAPEQIARITTATTLMSLLGDALRVHGQTARIEILGHTDNDGSDVENAPLAQARADSVVRLLSASMPDEVALEAHGVGSAAPLTAGITEAEKAMNRRVSMLVMVSDDGVPGSRP
jgi:OOP family OmpA-OmpF porin